MTTTSEPSTIDDQAVEEFAGRLFELFTGAALSCLIDIGHRTGLFEAAAEGPATSAELATRADLGERYVREWLAAMVTAHIFEYEPSVTSSWLPREHAVCLTRNRVENLAPVARFSTMLAGHVDGVTDAFRRGGGVPYDAFVPEIHDVMEALWGPMHRDLLVSAIVPLAPGLAELLAAGARVADVACGMGDALLTLAASYPASTFVGYDLDANAIVHACRKAAAGGLANVRFEQCDAAELTVVEPFDAVFVFNALHDQAAPDRGRIDRAFARRYFKRASRIVNVAWSTAVGSDFAYDETTGPKPPGTDLINRYMDRVITATQHNDAIALRFNEVVAMIRRPKTLLTPAFALRVLHYSRQTQKQDAVEARSTAAGRD